MANGDTLLILEASAGKQKATGNPATFATRNGHLVLLFDDTQDEEIVFAAKLPNNYDGGTITAYIHWSANGVTTGNVVWEVAVERIGDGVLDIDADSFDTVNSVTDAAPGTDGFVTVASVALTNKDSLAANEQFRLQVGRDGANNSTNDTMAADAQLHMIELRETS